MVDPATSPLVDAWQSLFVDGGAWSLLAAMPDIRILKVDGLYQ